jgi:hypothetical protein
MRTGLHGQSRLAGVVALSALVGILAAAVNVGAIGLLPPKVKPVRLQIAAAATRVLVDRPDPSVVYRRVLPPEIASLVKRTELLGRVMVSPPVLDRIAAHARIPREQLAGVARTTGDVPLALAEPGSEQRASEIVQARKPYRLEVQARPIWPILEISAQAPTPQEAARLADAAPQGLTDHLRQLADVQGFDRRNLVQLRRLGAARAAVVNSRAPAAIALLTFVTAFALSCAVLLGLQHRRRPRPPAPDPPPADDDWPRTTRALPWMLAGFFALLWLTPFNVIELSVSTPIDLKLDRLVLPFVVGAWLVTMCVGGAAAPRIRLTWIHAAIAAFLLIAYLSVVLDARQLNQTLELTQSLKKLPLVTSYVLLFVIVASAIRPTEVRAFLSYTLGLAVICGLGIIWEYRFKQNLFHDWADRLLPSPFVVGHAEAASVDNIGRRLVRGPAEVGLEAVTMLALALPIALVAFLHTRRWTARVLLCIAACVLLAATFATFRKSALLALVGVGLTLVAFRRREVLRLAPVALVVVVIVSMISPGALWSTWAQFIRPDRASVPTVSDRSADYDAVRPDVWSHLAFGRGWGSYEHAEYRILDSEILHRAIETGVVGLLAYLLVIISVVLGARRTIASRDAEWAPLALIGATAASGFLVVSLLYDVLSFPHAAYIFLYMAGLVAVVVGRERAARAPPRGEQHDSGAARTKQDDRDGGRDELPMPFDDLVRAYGAGSLDDEALQPHPVTR